MLRHKLGPTLFQLPAHFKADRDRLASFLKLLPKRYQYAFEFRDASWYEPPILKLLSDRNVALCLSDHRDAPAPWEVTAEHIYVRGHGPTGEYRGRYGEKTLQQWTQIIAKWKRKGHTVYCYFDNDQKSAAPKDAKRLAELLNQKRRLTA